MLAGVGLVALREQRFPSGPLGSEPTTCPRHPFPAETDEPESEETDRAEAKGAPRFRPAPRGSKAPSV